MRRIMLVALPILMMLPMTSAINLGGFEITDDGSITGTYAPSGLAGTISCYVKDKHIMDVIYTNDSIDLSINYFDTLDMIVEKNPFLKENLEQALMKEAFAAFNITNTSSFTMNYKGVVVELHDIPTRFLRVVCDKIIVNNIHYNITEKDGMIKLEKDNFSASLFSTCPMKIEGDTVVAYKTLMLASFSYIQEKNLENAFCRETIGGEMTINDYTIQEADYVSYFGNVSVTTNILEKGKIALTINGDEKSGGKILKINLGKNVCISSDFNIVFDGRSVECAESFEDVLDPDDDGLNPEYYVLSPMKGEEGTFLLVSIPHFSEHQLVIQFIVENTAVKIMAVFLGMIITTMAGFYLFKK